MIIDESIICANLKYVNVYLEFFTYFILIFLYLYMCFNTNIITSSNDFHTIVILFVRWILNELIMWMSPLQYDNYNANFTFVRELFRVSYT